MVHLHFIWVSINLRKNCLESILHRSTFYISYVVQNNCDTLSVSEIVTNIQQKELRTAPLEFFGDSNVRSRREGSLKSQMLLLLSVRVTVI
jgi:hypothetical protein